MDSSPYRSESALAGFVEGVEEHLDSAAPPWHIFSPPAMARREGAPPPPPDLDDPVWSPSAGWIERDSAVPDGGPKPFVWVSPSNVEPSAGAA